MVSAEQRRKLVNGYISHSNERAAIVDKEISDDDQLILVAPITCQNGNGLLKFNYWILGDQSAASLKVCTQDGEVKSCTQPIIYTESPNVTVDVVHPNAAVFEIDIVASNITQSTILILDNIDYKSDRCDDVEKPNGIEKNTEIQ
ncbi:hypothetical protein DICVIV_08963 [Dictyocaulus viviparus]|uniref:Uncharacterized protein n=1 Tax=Dictyocaulus viviparus TaxID=29172 RepID=A0A0D8XK76_DICVI|nr:hypothetical protein DICVIV_08963 [Dictyocaulus viviparus]